MFGMPALNHYLFFIYLYKNLLEHEFELYAVVNIGLNRVLDVETLECQSLFQFLCNIACYKQEPVRKQNAIILLRMENLSRIEL